jgi:LacI family transcriptional regulator
MKKEVALPESVRVAVLWPYLGLQAQDTYRGICRRAESEDRVTLRRFDAFHLGFQRGIVQPLRDWVPHGIISRMTNAKRLRFLRRAFPGVPVVSCVLSPSDEVDACVVADGVEAMGLARDHFRSRGVRQMALFCGAHPHAAMSRLADFREVVPDGLFLTYAGGNQPAERNVVGQWLLSLPKPAGVLTLETQSSAFVLRCCRDVRLRVPEDIQLIGMEAEDVALACEPHLTSLELPGEQIGEAALDALLRMLRRETPSPPPVLRVPGVILVERRSTALVQAGAGSMTLVLKLMKTHACRGVSAAWIAREAGIGLTTLYKEFAASVGCTPASHLRRLRLEEACRLLRETPASVTAIARTCGFRAPSPFVNFFRRQTGQTPTAYRQSTPPAEKTGHQSGA